MVNTDEISKSTYEGIEAEENFRRLIKHAPVAMCLFNGKDHVVRIANERALELWGKRLEDVINKPLFEGFSEIQGQGLKELLDDVYNTGERFIANERVVDLPRNNNMQSFYINFLYEPIKDKNGKVNSIIGIARDVTEMVLNQQKIDSEKEEIKKQMLKASINAQEQERKFISNELHDNVCQILATTKLLLERVEGKNKTEKKYVLEISNNIEKAMMETRELSHGLNPALLDFVDLPSAVGDIVSKINLSGKISFHFEGSCYDKKIKISKEIELAVLRIIQAQVVNIIKHSGAATAEITLACEHNFVELIIEDNGKGFDINTLKKGLGFQNIINRAELFNGIVSLKSAPGEGCILKIKIPFTKE